MVEGEERSSSSLRHRARIRLPKQLARLRETLSSISLPQLPRIRAMDLFTERMPALPPHWNIGWPIIARLVGLFLLISFVYGLVVFKVFGNGRAMQGQHYFPESIRSFVQGAIDPKNIEKYLFEVSYDDHMAGTVGDYALAERIKNYFITARLDGVANDEYVMTVIGVGGSATDTLLAMRSI